MPGGHRNDCGRFRRRASPSAAALMGAGSGEGSFEAHIDPNAASRQGTDAGSA